MNARTPKIIGVNTIRNPVINNQSKKSVIFPHIFPKNPMNNFKLPTLNRKIFLNEQKKLNDFKPILLEVAFNQALPLASW